MVTDFDLTNHVEFVGKVSREAIPEWLGKFDIYLFTSIWPEPMARSVMEAMAAGLLVIGTEVGGQTEMLNNGENALTFQAEDATDLANQIAYAIANLPLRLQMAQAGQQMVLEKFTLDRMINEIETYLLQINNS
jgi:glycosyltransferase involved in cell wall biosynthesis